MIASHEGVAFVERLDGPRADRTKAPQLLVEVPHGADRRAHYDALRARLEGPLPDDLHVFFHVNTDVGAWQYGRRVAERLLAARPELSVLLVRSLVPRTFVDVNRLEEAGDSLASGGMTAGVAPYVKNPRDVSLLLELHRAYVAIAERAYALVCDSGGLALCPHTYGPRTMGIPRIDDDIVTLLRQAHEPEAWASWPLRAEVDLLTRTPLGTVLAIPGAEDALVAGYAKEGLTAVIGGSYALHPATQTHRFSAAHPGQVLCLEVRRDLLVDTYQPFDEMDPLPAAIERVSTPLVEFLLPRL